MKIYLLPVPAKMQPATSAVVYPPHNKANITTEQDFLTYLQRHPELLTDSPERADWHYLPLFWGRWHLAHDYGATGLDELAAALSAGVLNDAKTFTVVNYSSGPLVDTGRMIRLQVSRRTDGPYQMDIPLLCAPHRRPLFARWTARKKYSGGFIGRAFTHPIRGEMIKALAGRADVSLYDGEDVPTRAYARNLLESWVALSPRGYGGTSFRFFEAMQLGTVPLLIGDLDVRPFPRQLNWDAVSLYRPTVDGLPALLDRLDRAQLTQMGYAAQTMYAESLDFQKWPRLALNQLEEFNPR